MALNNLYQNLIVVEEHAQLVRIDVVYDELVKELQNQDATLVNLLPVGVEQFRIDCLT